jgi:hypothetical protein
LDRCFNILIPKPDEIFNEFDFENRPTTSKTAISTSDLTSNLDNDDSDTDDDDFVEVKLLGDENDDEEELRFLGFLNGRDSEYTRNFELNLNLKFDQNEDNRILVEIIKDLYKELKYSHLDSLTVWIKSLSAVRNATDQLKRAIELKNSLQNSLKNIEGLGIDLDDLKPKNKRKNIVISSQETKLASCEHYFNDNKLFWANFNCFLAIVSTKRPVDDIGDESNDKRRKMLKVIVFKNTNYLINLMCLDCTNDKYRRNSTWCFYIIKS